MIAWLIGMSAAIIICALHYIINERPYEGEPLEPLEPVDQTIVLWWGLDGLRMNEDGTLEWVSRRKSKPVQEDVFYQPFQSIQAYNPNLFDQTQSTRASIDALMAQNVSLRMQALQAQQPAQLINSLQQCCVQYPAQYPPYFYEERIN